MRIVDLKTFVTLPRGTLFHEYDPCVTGPLTIKYDTNPHVWNDWYEHALDGMPASSGSDQLFDRLEDMEKQEMSYPLEANMMGRHGLYPSEGLFMIYEKADVETLIAMIQRRTK